jgi:hypothetical protein
VQFAGYIPFYPDCSTTYATDTEVAARPTTAEAARKAAVDFLQTPFQLG